MFPKSNGTIMEQLKGIRLDSLQKVRSNRMSTCRSETFRLVLALAAQHESHLEQLDVNSAFLHTKIDEEVNFEQPEGYQEKARYQDSTSLEI